MRLSESETYDFDWWTVIRGKRICPLIRCVNFLECPQIGDFTAFVSLVSAWSAIIVVILEWLLYLLLPFQKQFCLSDIVDSDWSGTGEISQYFAYQRAKFFAGNKITYTNSLYLQNAWYVSPSPKPFGNEIMKISGTCYPISQQSSNFSPAIFKKF